MRTCYQTIGSATIFVIATTSCAVARHPATDPASHPSPSSLPKDTAPPAEPSVSSRRSAKSVQLLAEAFYVAIQDVVLGREPSPDVTRSIWRRRFTPGDTLLGRLDTLALSAIRAPFGPEPALVLDSLRWTEVLPSSTSNSMGILLNIGRITALANAADSAIVPSPNDILFDRPKGDYLILVLLSHEIAHVALNGHPIESDRSIATVECQADILAGYLDELLTYRLGPSSSEVFAFGAAGQLVFDVAADGDWTGSATHPDRSQRQECFASGVTLYLELSRIGGRQDEIIPASQLGGIAVAIARHAIDLLTGTLIISHDLIPSAATPLQARALAPFTSNGAEMAGIRVVLDAAIHAYGRSDSAYASLAGDSVSRGTSLFSAPIISIVPTPTAFRWRCAYLHQLGRRLSTLQCYVLGDIFHGSLLLFDAELTIGQLAKASGLTSEKLAPPIPDGVPVSIGQWLLRANKRTAMLTVIIGTYSDRVRDTNRGIAWLTFQPEVSQPPPNR